jgi:hypothetical protein
MFCHLRGYLTVILFLSSSALLAETIILEHRGGDLLDSATRDRFIAADHEANALRLARSYLITNEMGVTAKSIDNLGDLGAARIIFDVPAPDVSRALLLIYLSAGASENLPTSITVNGRTRPYVHQASRMLTGGWARHDIPAEDLKAGANEVVIRGGRLHVDTFSHTSKSSRSFDGAKAFKKDALGPDGDWSGEYMVRLRVYGYAPTGEATSAITDSAAACREAGISPSVAVRKVSLHADESVPQGTRIQYAIRSGSTSTPTGQSWSDWRALVTNTPIEIAGDRFLQWRASLTSDSSLRTPVLRGVRLVVEADVARPDVAGMKVEAFDNPRIVRGSYPFTWESDTPRIRYLREKYNLLAVIGGNDQLNQQMALREWVSRRWDDGWSGGKYKYTPPWNAIEILDLAPQQLCWADCPLYSATLSQSATAVGFCARNVIIDHHCLVEIWSDQLQKWILQDPGPGYGPHGYPVGFAYRSDGKWLNALEVHEARRNKQAIMAVPHLEREVPWAKSTKSKPTLGETKLNEEWLHMFARFAIPLRNNHLSQPEPAELEHGREHFHWNGYLWWSDSVDDPAYVEYSNLSNREGDFYWPLNQVAVDLHQQDRDTLLVDLDSLTPNLARYEASLDGRSWAAVQSGFRWPLHAGVNHLRLRTVNAFGVTGRETAVSVKK